MQTDAPLAISIVIPTYRRERVLVETINFLLCEPRPPMELLIVDQTEQHEPQTHEALRALEEAGLIRWLRLTEPSIPAAMNRGLEEARAPIVLFLDDDVRPDPGLLVAHLLSHEMRTDSLVAGRVIQPWQEGGDFAIDKEFHYACTVGQEVTEFIGCHFSVRRSAALAIGGFDENFVKVAYRFEAEFARRFRTSGGHIWFEPKACLHHLKAESGGTRTFGNFLRTIRPDHAVGAYYFALRTLRGKALLRALVTRPLASVVTRHHLKRPWWIPLTLIGELRAVFWALALHARGPRLIARPR